MSLELPRRPLGASEQEKQFWWQQVVEAVEAHETAQQEVIDAQGVIINRIRRMLSHTVPTTILKATEDGAVVEIEVLDHVRVYGDGTTLSITGATYGGKSADTMYACYYDDATLVDTSPSFTFTTSIDEAQAAAGESRHFCGLILTPELASGDVIESGGVYAAGSSPIGGELL